MAATAQVLETIDPATGEVIAEVPDASAADVDAAVARAREAFRPGGAWRSLAPAARAQVIWRIGELIDRNGDELAELETPRPGPADRNLAERQRGGRGRALPLLRRLGDEDCGRDECALVPGHAQLHAARAHRRLRADHPLELSASDHRVEARARARLREHLRGEARRANATDRTSTRGAHRRSRHPRRGRRGRHRRPGGRSCARRASRRRQDLLHRLDGGRTLGHQGVGAATSSVSRSSSAARTRPSCSTTHRSRPRSPVCCREGSSTADRCARRTAVSMCSAVSPTRSPRLQRRRRPR